MGEQSTSSSSSSSSESSGGHCQREEKGMDQFEYPSLNYTSAPAPGFIHSRGKKHHHHRHRHHSCASPPSPSHHRRHFFEHPSMEGLHHFPMGCPQHQQLMEHPRMDGPHHHCLPPSVGFPDQHHHYKEGQLRVKPPKHLKKVHKLHRKLMKAYKLPKSTRHAAYHVHRMQFPPPKAGFFSVLFGYSHHPPGCCRHSMEAMEGPSRLYEMGILHERSRCHGRRPHPACPRGSLIKSEVAGDDIANIVSPKGMKAPAKPPVEGAAIALTCDVPPGDEPEPVVSAP